MMATTWNYRAEPTAADKLEKWMQGALAVNRAMESTLVDVVAAYTPWLASVIPASIGFYNVTRRLGFFPWQAWIYAIVVECLGLATVATTLKFWSWNQETSGKKAPFWLAMLTGVFYLVITLSVNVILDDGNATVKFVKALASTFSVVGALVVAMRSQQGKAEKQLDDEKDATAKTQQEAQLRWQSVAQAEREKAKADHEKEVETLRLNQQKELESLRIQAEERRKEKEADRAFRKELKLAEIQLKLSESAAKVSGNFRNPGGNFRKGAESFGNFPESGNIFPETFGKWKDWRDVPVEQRKRIAGMAPKQVRAEFGTSEKSSSNWVRNAQQEFGSEE
jgi:hypothetical protein